MVFLAVNTNSIVMFLMGQGRETFYEKTNDVYSDTAAF